MSHLHHLLNKRCNVYRLHFCCCFFINANSTKRMKSWYRKHNSLLFYLFAKFITLPLKISQIISTVTISQSFLIIMSDSSILSEFKDVTPVDIRDPENGFCQIDIFPECILFLLWIIVVSEYVGILCACVKSGEISDRVYRLTEEVIILSPTFITAWYIFSSLNYLRIVRQQCIKQLGVDWSYEFKFLDKIRDISEKCYQTW